MILLKPTYNFTLALSGGELFTMLKEMAEQNRAPLSSIIAQVTLTEPIDKSASGYRGAIEVGTHDIYIRYNGIWYSDHLSFIRVFGMRMECSSALVHRENIKSITAVVDEDTGYDL